MICAHIINQTQFKQQSCFLDSAVPTELIKKSSMVLINGWKEARSESVILKYKEVITEV